MKRADWIKEIEGLADDKKTELIGALETLEKWEAFRIDFGWTDIFELILFLNDQLGNR